MRVAIILDMEAAAQIEDFRELYPIYPEYWRHGRRKLTSDVAAAATGLIEGGATEVVVMNHHGAGEVEWPNVIAEDLPSGVSLVEWDKPALRDHVDAAFHVGSHARGGSQSFHSHTILPGLRLRLDGELLAESHWWALTGAVPVLGIVGSAALREGLGFLSDVPFLAVQSGANRHTPRPRFASEEESAATIRAFARAAIGDAAARRAFLPRDFVLEASLQNGDDAAEAMTGAGWTRTSRTEFRIEAADWRSDGEPVNAAIDAAIEATWTPYSFVLEGLDASSEAAALAYPREAFDATDRLIQAWTTDRTVEWITPAAAARWEGLEVGQA